MRTIDPDLVCIMETELWLNFLHAAKEHGAKTCVINGRFSESSFERASNSKGFYSALFGYVDECRVQSSHDAERFSALGAKSVEVFGNSKYDEAAGSEAQIEWRKELGIGPNEKLIVVGSARGEYEEDFILHGLIGVDARIIFAPRHIERSNSIVAKAGLLKLDSELKSAGNRTAKILVLDTLGELSSTYQYADIAIIGGGFDNLGGQNIIQPMAAGCPVICGPNMRNFREPFEEGLREGAVRVANTSDELRSVVSEILMDSETRKTMGEAGRKLVERNRGAARRYADFIAEQLTAAKIEHNT